MSLNKIQKHLNIFLPAYVISSYFISAHLFALSQFSVVGINLSMTDYVTLLWIFIAIAIGKNYKFSFKYNSIEIRLLLLFTVYAGFEVLHGMYGFKSLSLFLQLLRNLFIFLLIYYSIQRANIIEINRLIFKLSFWMSILMLFLYGLFITVQILPINIFEYGEFQSIRFEGLSGDANFYAFLMSVALLIGFYNSSKDLNVLNKYLYLMPIGINIVITISRSAIVALIVTFIFTSILYEKKLSSKFKKIFTLFFIFTAFFYLSMIKLPNLNVSIYEWYSLRATQGSPRIEMWLTLLNYIQQQPIFGYGLRASEYLLGGYGRYAHNSYLELLVDYGMIGFIIFVSFMFLVFLKGIKLININEKYKAWLHSYLILCILFGGFTLLYWPLLWVLIALILGGYSFEKDRLNNNFV
jgi:O-antigen ligase